VVAKNANVTGDAKRGFLVEWSAHPPAGHDFEVRVSVLPTSARVVCATADYNPE
jgi:hypothetical protein